MEEPKKSINELIIKFLQQDLSDAEQVLLNEWLAVSDENKLLFKNLTNEEWINSSLRKLYEYDEEEGWQKISRENTFNQLTATKEKSISSVLKIWQKLAVAASIFLILGIAGYWFLNREKSLDTDISFKKSISNDVYAPIKTKAFISLSNGSIISLDTFKKGTMTTQGDVSILKTTDDQVLYQGNSTEEQYNILFNPRGSKAVSLTLNDGSTVWLNSESSIKYPIAFIHTERKVEITGEAYFEVAKNPSKPFKVTIKKLSGTVAEIEVLGTSFNVNGYEDEATINTTLLEGHINISANQLKGAKASVSELLKPGQQAQLSSNGTIRLLNEADIEEIMSWKNGFFQFESADIKTILRQISRWYDIEISFEKEPGNQKYFMIINRENSLTEVLKVIQTSGLKFSIVGNKLLVQ